MRASHLKNIGKEGDKWRGIRAEIYWKSFENFRLAQRYPNRTNKFIIRWVRRCRWVRLGPNHLRFIASLYGNKRHVGNGKIKYYKLKMECLINFIWYECTLSQLMIKLKVYHKIYHFFFSAFKASSLVYPLKGRTEGLSLSLSGLFSTRLLLWSRTDLL